jgi:hypothetical protein
MKLGKNIIPHEGISTAYIINPPITNTDIAAFQISEM